MTTLHGDIYSVYTRTVRMDLQIKSVSYDMKEVDPFDPDQTGAVRALHPFVRPRNLSRGERGRLARATLLIAERAYRQAGVTNAPGRVKTLKRLGYPRRDYRFSVFAREGLPCYRCSGSILRVEVSARRLYYCPECQAEG